MTERDDPGRIRMTGFDVEGYGRVPKSRRRQMLEIAIWPVVVIAAVFVGVVVVLIYPQPKPSSYQLQWEQIGKYEYRACDPKTGDLLYKEVNSLIAGDHIVVVEGGCR